MTEEEIRTMILQTMSEVLQGCYYTHYGQRGFEGSIETQFVDYKALVANIRLELDKS